MSTDKRVVDLCNRYGMNNSTAPIGWTTNLCAEFYPVGGAPNYFAATSVFEAVMQLTPNEPRCEKTGLPGSDQVPH